MSRILTHLFSVLCLSSILIFIAISLNTASVNDKSRMRYKQNGKKKPHIIIIFADDMGWNDVSFHGSDQIPTPNIDALAYNGIILNNHYMASMCTPSRSALMTGKYPIHLGMQHSVLLPAEPRGLPLEEKLMSEYLREAGYTTHMVGKWHLGYHKREYTPTHRGFDTHFGYYNGLQDYYNHIVIEPELENRPLLRGFDMRRNLTVAWDTIDKYSTDLFTEEAVRLINTHDASKPMFLYLAHLAVHSGNSNAPLQAPDEEIAKYFYIMDPERRIYAAMTSKLDQSVGEVIEALKNRGMLENSIIVFMTDNGAPTDGILYNRGSNHPLRGIKSSAWEGGIRGVAAIWSPLIQKRRRVSNQLIYIADWLPTLLSAAGTEKNNVRKLDGHDMWPILVSDTASNRDELLINIDDISGYEAIRRGRYKYMNGNVQMRYGWIGDFGRLPQEKHPPYNPERVLHSKAGNAIASIMATESVLTSEKILQLREQAEVHCNVEEKEKIDCDPSAAPCLFDIERDPCEMINIIEQKPDVAESLKYSLKQYRLTVIPPSNMELNLRANPKYWNNTWTYWLDSDPLSLI